MALHNLAKGVEDPALRAKADADLRDRLQADPDLQHLLPGARRRQRRARHRRRSPRSPATRSSPRDGVERPIDVLVVATGFYTTELPIAEHITGRDGRTLADTWREGGMAAYKGTTVPGFPNLFMIVGPNTGLGPLQHGVHDRVAGGLPPRRGPHHGPAPVRRRRADGRTRPATWNDALQRRMKAHRVEHRRLRELVPRRARPQHHAVAAHHRRVPRRCWPASTWRRTTSQAPYPEHPPP